jgi:hypothetical protein
LEPLLGQVVVHQHLALYLPVVVAVVAVKAPMDETEDQVAVVHCLGLLEPAILVGIHLPKEQVEH